MIRPTVLASMIVLKVRTADPTKKPSGFMGLRVFCFLVIKRYYAAAAAFFLVVTARPMARTAETAQRPAASMKAEV